MSVTEKQFKTNGSFLSALQVHMTLAGPLFCVSVLCYFSDDWQVDGRWMYKYRLPTSVYLGCPDLSIRC